jgi:hypothetical protein
MKKTLLSLTFLTLSSSPSFAQVGDFTPQFGTFNGHSISSFEPCVHRDQSGGWYDHCFFDMEGTNDFGDKVSKEAKECGVEANKRLYDWLNTKGSDVENAFSVLERVHGKKSIYIIVTDTMGTTIPGKSQESSSLWTWSGTGDGSSGKGHYFKFNIGISKNGKCSIPSERDMLSTIKRWVGEEKFELELSNIVAGASESVSESVEDSPRTFFQKIFGTKESRSERREERKQRRDLRRQGVVTE